MTTRKFTALITTRTKKYVSVRNAAGKIVMKFPASVSDDQALESATADDDNDDRPIPYNGIASVDMRTGEHHYR